MCVRLLSWTRKIAVPRRGHRMAGLRKHRVGIHHDIERHAIPVRHTALKHELKALDNLSEAFENLANCLGTGIIVGAKQSQRENGNTLVL